MLGYLFSNSLYVDVLLVCFFFFKQKTAYEMRISDWSSDVCSSDPTYMVINALKVFDIVFVVGSAETNGTEVIAERMIRWFFISANDGRAAAIAVEIGRASCRERVCQYV